MPEMASIQIFGLPELKAKLEGDAKAKIIGIEKGILRSLIYLQSYTRERKLHGDPLMSHHGAAGLSGSLTYSEPRLEGDSIKGDLGTSKTYAPIHEFGGTFTIPEHIRRMTMVFGRPLKEPIEVTVRRHTATYPERSFLRSTLKENVEKVVEFLKASLKEANGIA